jgi:hypothetical protein
MKSETDGTVQNDNRAHLEDLAVQQKKNVAPMLQDFTHSPKVMVK